MNLKNPQQPNTREFCRYFVYNAAWTLHSSYLFTALGSRDLHSSSSCSSAGPAQNVPFHACACEERLINSADSSDKKTPLDKALKLISGSCYLLHPDKEETGGEYAHFICSEEQTIGVADGVGDWADLGVDSGKYPRELMSNSVDAIREEPKVQLTQLGCWKKHTCVQKLRVHPQHASLHLLIGASCH